MKKKFLQSVHRSLLLFALVVMAWVHDGHAATINNVGSACDGQSFSAGTVTVASATYISSAGMNPCGTAQNYNYNITASSASLPTVPAGCPASWTMHHFFRIDSTSTCMGAVLVNGTSLSATYTVEDTATINVRICSEVKDSNGNIVSSLAESAAYPITPPSGGGSCALTLSTPVAGVCNNNLSPSNVWDDYYESPVTVTWTGVPGAGYIYLGGAGLHWSSPYSRAISAGSGSYTFPAARFYANGTSNAIVAYYSEYPSCSASAVAPAVNSCSTAPACTLTLSPPPVGACNNNGTPTDGSDDYYASSLTLNYTNRPTTGYLYLYNTGLHPSSTWAVAVSAMGATSYTIPGVLVRANGSTNVITAYFSDDTSCTGSVTTAAVNSCSSVPPCSMSISVPVAGACSDNGTSTNSTDDYYTTSVTVSFTNNPTSGYLYLNGAALHPASPSGVPVSAISGSSYTFTGVLLRANGSVNALGAYFGDMPACSASVNAPSVASCSVPVCSINSILTPAGACNNNGTVLNTADDYYTTSVTVNFSYKPASGNLVLSGAALHASNTVTTVAVGSTTTATSHTFANVRLKANGTSNALTAQFSAAPACSLTTTNTRASACSSCPGPILLSAGDSYQLTAQSGMTSYRWFKDNVGIPGATSATYVVNSAGVYYWSALNSSNCPITGECAHTFLSSGFIVGDLVFDDANRNGLYDSASESGIPGITVELVDIAGASLVPPMTTVTDASGKYSFVVATAGTYRVRVTPSVAYPRVTSTVGTDNGTDNNNDGTQPGGAGTPVTSFAFVLAASSEPGSIGGTNIENTIDIGLTDGTAVLDFGDASKLPVASSTVIPGLMLGSQLDAELSITANSTADADDNNGTDDEDGSSLYSVSGGLTTTTPIIVTNTTSGPAYLNVWMDYNNNGVLSDIGEHVTTDILVPSGTSGLSQNITFTPPAVLGVANFTMRVRLTSVMSPSFSGYAGNGEVEDYLIRVGTCNADIIFMLDNSGSIDATEWADTTTSVQGIIDRVLASGSGNRAAVVHYAGPLTYPPTAQIYIESDFTENAATAKSFPRRSGTVLGYGDDAHGAIGLIGKALDGISDANIFSPTKTLTRVPTRSLVVYHFTDAWRADGANSYIVNINNTTVGSAGAFTNFTDFKVNRNAKFVVTIIPGDGPSVPAAAAVATRGGSYTGSVEANPADPDGSSSTPRRFQSSSTFLLTSAQMDSVAADICAPVVIINSDYGDNSTITDATATVIPNLRIGASVDIDSGSMSNVTATGDDVSGSDDEELVLPVFKVGVPVIVPIQVTNATTSPAYLRAWLDSDGDGVLSASEQVINDTLAANAGTVTRNYTIIPSVTGTARAFRVTLSDNSVALPIGAVGRGEVEDYSVDILCPTLTMAPATLPVAYAGTAYSTTLTASGGSAPYTWSIVSGSLPSGITLNSTTGVIAGVAPATSMSVPITIAATDAKGCSVQSSGYKFIVVAMSVGNLVWNDANCNGLKDATESGIGGIVMSLYTPGPDNIAYNADDALVKTNTSAADGSYRFDYLVPGNYYVRFTPPAATFPLATPTTVNLDNSIDNDSNGQQPGGGGTVVRSPVITLTPGSETTADDGDNNTDLTIDFGLRPGFRIGDLVWRDDNDNGIRDASEAGLAGVTVNLMSPGANGVIGGGDDTVVMTTTTNAAGNYIFTLPVAGNFFIRVTPPAGFDVPSLSVVTADNGVEDDNNGSQPGIPATYVYSNIFNLTQCKEPGNTGTTNNETSIDIGLVPNSLGVGNLIFLDENGNGHADPGEGLDGVTVQLYRSDQTPGVSTPIATTTSAGGGYYKFINLPRASYIIHIPAAMFGTTSIMKGMYSVTGAQAGPQDDDSGEDGIDSLTPETTGISTRIFSLATNAMPVDGGTETGIGKSDDNILTGGDSNYDFTIDLGFYRWVGVGNLVFYDANGDGKAQSTEGVNGVTVQLYTEAQTPEVDTPVATSVTANSGKYLFNKIKPGIYRLHIPASMFVSGGPLFGKLSIAEGKFGDDDVGEDGLNDTDPSTEGVSTNAVFLVAGVAPTALNGETGVDNASDDTNDAAIDLTVDFGFQDPVAVGNLVFYDANANGRYDSGEGVNGVTVELYRGGSTLGYSLPVATATTSSGGHYKFTGLPGGSYFVYIPAINFTAGKPLLNCISMQGSAASNTDDNVGEDGLDSPSPSSTGISTSVFNLAAGSMPTNANGETGFLATEDDANSQDANGNMTMDLGFIAVDPNRVGVGNSVFSDYNGNNIFDDGEGVDGVTLELYKASTNTLVGNTISANGGVYYFGNLNPDTYYIKIPAANFTGSKPLEGAFSIPGQGGDNGLDDDLDENGDDPVLPSITGVRSTNFTLTVGGEPTDYDTELGKNTLIDFDYDANNDLTIDFGFYQPCGVGNLVFVDANGNGRADNGEGVAGVTVQLFKEGDDPVISTPLATQVTESARKGFFMFLDIRPGSYFLHIPASMFQSGAPLAGKTSLLGVETSPVDDNLGENGVDPSDIVSQGIDTGIFQLRPGTMPAGTTETGQFGTADNSNPNGISGYNIDLTQDFGFVSNVCVGNLVFKDLNLDGKFTNGVDIGLNGVTVQLWSQPTNGTPALVATTTTANGGLYQFCVPPGSYKVKIPATMFQPGAPLAYTQATTLGTMVSTTSPITWQDDSAGQDAGDGGTALSTGASTGTFTLALGTMPTATNGETGFTSTSDDQDDTNSNLTIDLGFKPLPLMAGNLVFKDNNANAKFDTGDTGIAGVTLKLFPIGADPLTSTPAATSVTGTDGSYMLTIYAEGQYFIHVPKTMFATGAPLVGMTSSPGFSLGTGDDNVDENGIDAGAPSTSGVNSSVFSLVYGSTPTDSATEKGFRATMDSSADANGDMTIDFGFRIPPPGTPLAGRVRRDLNGDSTISTTDLPLAGVEVSIYSDANQNGILDTNEMSAEATATTTVDGSYVIEGLSSGAYIVQATPLPGAIAVADSDGGLPDQTSVVLGTKPVTYIDFLQCLCPDTFSQWQVEHSLGGNNGARDNPDGDGYDNLVEYALGSDPASGVQATSRFHLEATSGVDAVLIRTAQGHKDLLYSIEGSIDGKTWTVLATTSTSKVSGDDETLRYAGIASDPVFSGQRAGYVRLKVELDADQNGEPEATGYSPVQAFALPTFRTEQTTFTMPLLRDSLYEGTIELVGDHSVQLTKADGLKAALGNGIECYLEVLNGTSAGQRFEVDEAASTDASLSLLLDHARSTAKVLSSSLVDVRVAVRPHWTLESLLPGSKFHATTSASTADRVLFFENGAYLEHWVLAMSGNTPWVRTGDAKFSNSGLTRIIAPGEAFFVQSRSGERNVPVVGQVRTTPLVQKISTTAQLLGTGAVINLATTSISGFTAGDTLRLWTSDTVAGAAQFDGYTLSADGWVHDADNLAAEVVLAPFRGVFVRSLKDGELYWTP